MEFTNIQSAIIYLTSMLFLAFFSHLYQKNKKNYLLIIGMIPLLLIATFRVNVGTDFRNYHFMFIRHNNSSIIDLLRDGNLEVGYYLINRVGGVFNSFPISLLISATIILVIPIYTVKDNKHITLFLFSLLYSHFYIGSFNGIRQGIAVSIMFNAFYNLFMNKKVKYYILLTLLATTFHMTALFMLPFVFLNLFDKKKTNHLMIISSLVLVFAVVINKGFVIGKLENIPFLNKYFNYQSEREANNYSFYLSLFIFVLIAIFRKYFYKLNPLYKLFIVMVAFEVMFTYVGFDMVFVKRIASYFSISVMFLFSITPQIFIKKEQLIPKVLIVVYSISLFILSYWVYGFSNIFPYRI